MSNRLTSLAAIRQRHKRWPPRGSLSSKTNLAVCDYCEKHWPCDTARVLALLDKTEARLKQEALS